LLSFDLVTNSAVGLNVRDVFLHKLDRSIIILWA